MNTEPSTFDLILDALKEHQKDYLKIRMIDYMKKMLNRGVRPSWDNFITFGSFWKEMKTKTTKEQQFYFRSMWMKIFKEL